MRNLTLLDWFAIGIAIIGGIGFVATMVYGAVMDWLAKRDERRPR